MRKAVFNFVLIALVLVISLSFSEPASAQHYRLMEPDETDGSLPSIGSANGDIPLKSPYRLSDGITDVWRPINGMYNEPRGGIRQHLGIDMSTSLGRSIYPVHGHESSSNSAIVMSTATLSGYGNTVRVRHIIPVNGTGYEFDSFYSHLENISVVKDQQIKIDQRVGTEGNSGTEYIHLHMEFRTINEKGWNRDESAKDQPRHIAPSAFYWKKQSNWSLDTSFIAKMPPKNNCLRFRTVAKHTAGYYPSKSVKLYYKKYWNDNWSVDNMIAEGSTHCTSTSSDSDFHYYDLSGFATSGEDVFYYVEVADGKTGYKSYRPWQHANGDNPPTNRPFYHYVN